MYEQAPTIKPISDIEADTGGQLRPQYEVVARQAGHLACGDLLIEPVFGEVRVVATAELGYNEVRHTALKQSGLGVRRRSRYRRPLLRGGHRSPGPQTGTD